MAWGVSAATLWWVYEVAHSPMFAMRKKEIIFYPRHCGKRAKDFTKEIK